MKKKEKRLRSLWNRWSFRKIFFRGVRESFREDSRRESVLPGLLRADPDYIIFDEAVSGLDASVRKSVLDLLIRIQKNSGKGFLLITHDIDAALYTSQRIAVMKSGRILETVKYSGDIKVFESEYAKTLINSSLSGIKKQDISAKSG